MFRHHKELDATMRGALNLSNGVLPLVIVAYDQEEEAWLNKNLKGKKGNKHIKVRLDEDGSALARLEEWRKDPEESPSSADSPVPSKSSSPPKKKKRKAKK